MPVCCHLLIRRQPFERRRFQHLRTVSQIIKDLPVQDHESGIDPRLVFPRLFLKALYIAVVVDLDRTEPSRRLRRRDRRDSAMLPVKRKKRRNIHIRYPVSISQHKRPVITYIILNPQNPSGRQGFQPGIRQRDPPGLRGGIMILPLFVFQMKSGIRLVHIIMDKIILDDMSLVTAAHYEIMVPVCGINLHDMPQNRLVPDLHHGLGL